VLFLERDERVQLIFYGVLCRSIVLVPFIFTSFLSFKFVCFWFLSFVFMFRSTVYMNFFKHLSAYRSFWKHTFYSQFFHVFLIMISHFVCTAFFKTACVSRVTIVFLVCLFVSCLFYFFCIYNNYMISSIKMWRIRWFMFAT